VLRRLERQYAPRLIVSTRANRGHGQTCLEGYRRAWSLGARHVLQVDADGQCDPFFFRYFWDLRDQYPVVAGVRTRRDDGAIRTVISRALGLFLRVRFGVRCPDANVPYRLMRTAAVIETIDRIPPSLDLANVALAVLLASDPSCPHAFVEIRFRERRGGRSSVSLPGFARKAIGLDRDLRRLLSRPVPARSSHPPVPTAKDPAGCP
jgi:dolichol-phosphate mannosyltransferase